MEKPSNLNETMHARSFDRDTARRLLPLRPENSNKGSFGKLLVITGSEKYRGAAHLSLGAALRGGVGLVSFLGDAELCRELRSVYPEAIYLDRQDADPVALSRAHTATLIGCGSDRTDALFSTVKGLILSEGTPLVLDADALNAIAASAEGAAIFKRASRPLILTPHPAEFSRLTGAPTEEIQTSRLRYAVEFASEHRLTLVLKGSGTVVTDGESAYINTSGSSALAKGGSGDVLAGLIGALTASGMKPIEASALGVYLHGAAGDALAESLSTFGVTPSDLPVAIAHQLLLLEKERKITP